MEEAAEKKDGTISFDVGGHIFRVRRSLLEEFPSTILARSASADWQRRGDDDDDDSNRPIFIDRDAELFRYCLNYMRDGHVHLPHTESKAALLQELDYLCFDNVDAGSITTTFPDAKDAFESLALFEKNMQAEIDAAELRVQHMKFAHACFVEYMYEKNKSDVKEVRFGASDNEEIFSFLHSKKLNDSMLAHCFEKYGLRFVSSKLIKLIRHNRYPSGIYVVEVELLHGKQQRGTNIN